MHATTASEQTEAPRRAAESVVSVRGDIDHLAFAAGEREAALSAKHERPEREAADAALELVDDLEASARVGAWSAERLPPAAVVHEQLDDDALRGNRAEHSAALRTSLN